MKVKWVFFSGGVQLKFVLDDNDQSEGNGQGGMRVGLKSNEFNIKIPISHFSRPHPDLMAFASLVALRPWINKDLEVDAAVSPEFARMCWDLFRVHVFPIDPRVRVRKPGSTPVISFSGGVDSIAASEIFPDSVPYVYYKRIKHPDLADAAPHVQVSGITDVVEEVKKNGRNVFIVESDLEHICSPYPTLPSWFCISIGVLMLADQLDAGLLVMGGTFETYFMDMGRHWVGKRGKGLDPLAELVGLPICRPMLGVTEIGTMYIAKKSIFSNIARSCVLGTREKPCGICSKCIRKDLISLVLDSGDISKSHLNTLDINAPGVKAYSGNPPFYMQAQFEYCLSRLTSLPPVLKHLYTNLGMPKKEDTEWMEFYYQPATEISTPEGWRSYVEYEILKRIGRMSAFHSKQAHSFSR